MNVRQLEIEDRLVVLAAAILEFEQRLAAHEAALPGLLAQNGQAMESETRHRGALARAFAEQADSGETPGLNPPATWRAFHATAAAILDAHQALTAQTALSTSQLTACDSEINRIRQRALPALRGERDALNEELARIERDEAQAVATYESKRPTSTLDALRKRLGVA